MYGAIWGDTRCMVLSGEDTRCMVLSGGTLDVWCYLGGH